MLRKSKNNGQTSLEYAILLIVVIGALLAIQNYMKRGIQGRWKDSIDDMGDQYDPRTAITDIRQTLTSSTNTVIRAEFDEGGYWTKRTDESSSAETKIGTTKVGAY